MPSLFHRLSELPCGRTPRSADALRLEAAMFMPRPQGSRCDARADQPGGFGKGDQRLAHCSITSSLNRQFGNDVRFKIPSFTIFASDRLRCSLVVFAIDAKSL